MSIFIKRKVTVDTEIELHTLTDGDLLQCVEEAESRGLLVKKENLQLAEKLMAYFRRLHSAPQAALVQSNVRSAKLAVLEASPTGAFSTESVDALNKAKKAQRESLLVEGLLSSLIDRTFHHENYR